MGTYVYTALLLARIHVGDLPEAPQPFSIVDLSELEVTEYAIE